MDGLAWIDDFWKRAGTRVFSREEDGVIILPPNRVYRANPTAASLIAYLRRGGKASRLRLPSAEAERDVADFFGDLAALYRGEAAVNGTVSEAPYDFSFTKLPVLAEIAVTYRCNNACRFCYAGCGPAGVRFPVSPGSQAAAERCPELPTASLERIVDLLASDARVPFFSFTGGEPLLRSDIEKLASRARRRGMSTNLVTNGTLADRGRARSLAQSGLSSAQVSVEADSAALHDSLVGNPGAFERTVAGIEALRAAGIATQTNTTITRENMAAAPRMPAFLKKLGVDRFAMNLFIPTVRGPESDALFVGYSEIGKVVDEVASAARREGLVFYWYSPTPFGCYNPIARGLGNKSCAAADGLLSVAPDGSVRPCSSWDEDLGNLLSDGFAAVWFSPRAAALKRKEFAPDACRACSSFVACQGACPLYRGYLGLGPSDPSPCAAETARAQRSPA